MRKLKWNDNPIGLCGNIIAVAQCIGSNGIWRISKCKCKGRFFINDSTDYALKLVRPHSRDHAYSGGNTAKAACQAAEDKLCDVWPKYCTSPNHGIAYLKFDEPSKTGWAFTEIGQRNDIRSLVFWSDVITRRLPGYHTISETEALSRLEKPMEPKLILDIKQYDSVVVVRLARVSHSLLGSKHIAGNTFKLEFDISKEPEFVKYNVIRLSHYPGKQFISHDYSSIVTALQWITKLKSAVESLNKKHADKPSSMLPPVQDGWERIS